MAPLNSLQVPWGVERGVTVTRIENATWIFKFLMKLQLRHHKESEPEALATRTKKKQLECEEEIHEKLILLCGALILGICHPTYPSPKREEEMVLEMAIKSRALTTAQRVLYSVNEQ